MDWSPSDVIALVGVLSGVVGALAGALGGNLVQARSARNVWLREQQFAVLTETLEVAVRTRINYAAWSAGRAAPADPGDGAATPSGAELGELIAIQARVALITTSGLYEAWDRFVSAHIQWSEAEPAGSADPALERLSEAAAQVIAICRGWRT